MQSTLSLPAALEIMQLARHNSPQISITGIQLNAQEVKFTSPAPPKIVNTGFIQGTTLGIEARGRFH